MKPVADKITSKAFKPLKEYTGYMSAFTAYLVYQRIPNVLKLYTLDRSLCDSLLLTITRQ